MLLKFSYATFFTLTSIAGTDAFLAPALRNQARSPLFSDDDGFIDALKAKADDSDGGASEDEENEVSSGSSRFKELMEASKKGKASGDMPSGRAIQNPFLNPAPSTPQPGAAGVNIENLSVEDQAALLRQLMGNQNAAAPPLEGKQKRTDKAGRPTGRNKDADAIANTADLYFAQLKRDSFVRTLARYDGNDEVADAVMGDDGIGELDELLHKNPYLQGQVEEEKKMIEEIPEEALRPYFGVDEEDPAAKYSSGIKYKDILNKNRMKTKGGAAPEEPAPAVAETQPAPVAPTPEPVVESVQPEPVAPPQPVAEPEPPVEIPPPQQTTVTSSSDETTQQIRTLMGLTLKHRGGPGFGLGQLKGPDIDKFEDMVDKVTAILRQEGMDAAPADVPMMTASPAVPEPAPQVAASAAPPAPSAPADLMQVEGAVACIEGATTMFKNSPPTLKPSILPALRAALVSAVDTCSSATGIAEAADYSAAGPSSIEQIDGVIACIDGAVTMYKNSPANLKKDVVVALRAALVSAVSSCNSVIGDVPATATTAYQAPPTNQAAPPAPVAPVAPQIVEPEPEPVVVATPVEPEPAPVAVAVPEAVDANSKALQEIYGKIEAASGNGTLGIRSDLTSSEASALRDDLVEMRKLLMAELDAGIGAEKIPDKPAPAEEEDTGSPAVSKYQEMLAKAKAKKAAEAA